jgi:serine/threonine-protein kinase
VGAALDHLHQRGLVHRDVKPDNIFLSQNGSAKLMDLGLARGEVDVLTQTGVVLGTPHYMAPEQINGKPEPASDQYALAVTCFECLCGKRPYSGGDLVELIHKQVSAPVPRLGTEWPDCSPLLEAVLCKMMAKRPESRYIDMSTAVEQLKEALTGNATGLDTGAFVKEG